MKRVIRAGTNYKRIDNAKAFDNGRVLHDDWIMVSDEEAEKMAKQQSIEDPANIFFVKYDDIMNPYSGTYWVAGQAYHSYDESLKALWAEEDKRDEQV